MQVDERQKHKPVRPAKPERDQMDWVGGVNSYQLLIRKMGKHQQRKTRLTFRVMGFFSSFFFGRGNISWDNPSSKSTIILTRNLLKKNRYKTSGVVRNGSVYHLSSEQVMKSLISYCVISYFWWDCRGNLRLIPLRIDGILIFLISRE